MHGRGGAALHPHGRHALLRAAAHAGVRDQTVFIINCMLFALLHTFTVLDHSVPSMISQT